MSSSLVINAGKPQGSEERGSEVTDSKHVTQAVCPENHGRKGTKNQKKKKPKRSVEGTGIMDGNMLVI